LCPWGALMTQTAASRRSRSCLGQHPTSTCTTPSLGKNSSQTGMLFNMCSAPELACQTLCSCCNCTSPRHALHHLWVRPGARHGPLFKRMIYVDCPVFCGKACLHDAVWLPYVYHTSTCTTLSLDKTRSWTGLWLERMCCCTPAWGGTSPRHALHHLWVRPGSRKRPTVPAHGCGADRVFWGTACMYQAVYLLQVCHDSTCI
jgi:hypothetical protein